MQREMTVLFHGYQRLSVEILNATKNVSIDNLYDFLTLINYLVSQNRRWLELLSGDFETENILTATRSDDAKREGKTDARNV